MIYTESAESASNRREGTHMLWRSTAASSVGILLLAAAASWGGTAVGTTLSTRLVEVAERGDVEAARELLAGGADVNFALDGDGTPLIQAARAGELSMVILLLEHGADVNRFSAGDGNPLIMAAASGHMDIVRALLDKGADVNAFDRSDESPLINAARGGHLDVVDLLIGRRANVNFAVEVDTLRGKELRSPLSEARKYGHQAVVERLKRAGATR
jgi:ankyrin repeat protein